MKRILDPCCGAKMFWFDKNNSDVVFGDVRKEEHILCDGRKLSISPNLNLDFRNLPFENESFYLVVFDPPHLKQLGKNSWMAKKYGILSQNWENDIKCGFNECLRVLKTNGTLIFKWNNCQIPIKDIINVIERKPLFGHTTRQSKSGSTIWMTFMK